MPLFTEENRAKSRDGSKVQTRRLVKPQPDMSILTNPEMTVEFRRCPILGATHHPSEWGMYSKCASVGSVPIYGYNNPIKVGDVRYLCEPLTKGWCKLFAGRALAYYADDEHIAGGRHLIDWRWKVNTLSSMFMPKEAARTFFEITEVRVERLHDISCADAIAEGIRAESNYESIDCDTPSPIDGFERLWDSINKKKCPWSSNPWVWVYGYKKVDINE